MITLHGLDHVGIRIAHFERAIDFYLRFGFKVVRDDRTERVVVLRHASGVELNLLDFADQQAPHNVLMDTAAKPAGYTHIALQVPDIMHARCFLMALGIHITEGPVTFGDGKTSVFVRDPDCNVIEFTQRPLQQVRQTDISGTSDQEVSV